MLGAVSIALTLAIHLIVVRLPLRGIFQVTTSSSCNSKLTSTITERTPYCISQQTLSLCIRQIRAQILTAWAFGKTPTFPITHSLTSWHSTSIRWLTISYRHQQKQETLALMAISMNAIYRLMYTRLRRKSLADSQ